MWLVEAHMERSSFHGHSSGNSHSQSFSHFQGQGDHPNRAAEATDVRSAASQVTDSLNSPGSLETAMNQFQSVVNTVKQEDPQFFQRLASKVNTEFQPQKYNMASNESLLAGFNKDA